MLCHVNMALNPLDITWTILTSLGFLLKCNFFNSSAAKFTAYLQLGQTSNLSRVKIASNIQCTRHRIRSRNIGHYRRMYKCSFIKGNEVLTFWPKGEANDVGDLGSPAGAPQAGVWTVRKHALSENNAVL